MHGCIDPYCVALCVQVFFARKFAELRRNTAAKTDVRIRYTNQMIRGSKIMKLLAWEESFLASIFVRARTWPAWLTLRFQKQMHTDITCRSIQRQHN